MGNFLGVVLFIFGLIGYVCNIIAIAQSDYINGMVIVRILGVFLAPIGAVMGWF